ncbi:MAG: hypothetical protein GY853_16240 [PVC group bacterium]|nr:hypothetical protein [PVC group bacterium]
MELENVQKVLDDFRDNVIREAKKGMPRSSGALAQSLKSYVKESKNSIQISFTMDDYGWFQDEGVKGKDPSKVSPNAKITGQQAPNSRYEFGSKRYKGTWGKFVQSLAVWAKRKNVRLRDEKGRFKKGSYKAIANIIAGNIYNRGLKPSLFFTKPYEKYFKRLPDELIEKYALDMDELFTTITKESFKQ